MNPENGDWLRATEAFPSANTYDGEVPVPVLSRREAFLQGALWAGPVALGLRGLFVENASAAAPPLAPGTAALVADVLAFAQAEKIDFLGVGDMTSVYPKIPGPVSPVMERFRLPRVVSFAFAKSDELVDALPRNMAEYGKHDYGTLRPHAQAVARRLGDLLKQKGHRVAAGAPGLQGLPKMAARLAGLGWIGRSAMVITPEVGPRLVLEAVLTDAPLPVTADKLMECHCGEECRRCVEVCPAKALTGELFKELDRPAVQFDAEACKRWREKRGDISLEAACGLCVKVCPYGAKANLFAGAAKVAPPPELL